MQDKLALPGGCKYEVEDALRVRCSIHEDLRHCSGLALPGATRTDAKTRVCPLPGQLIECLARASLFWLQHHSLSQLFSSDENMHRIKISILLHPVVGLACTRLDTSDTYIPPL